MREFFRGWRRKLGALLLLVSVPLLVGWMRSLIVFDLWSFHIGNVFGVVRSGWGRFYVELSDMPSMAFLGYATGLLGDQPPQVGDRSIPYLAVLIPVSLAAAALILWPRKSPVSDEARPTSENLGTPER